MKLVKIWHNPQCSKSRAALEILQSSDCDKEVIEYLKATPNKQEIKDALKMLGLKPRELMRTKEVVYVELNLEDEESEDMLVDAMVSNPILIERPVLFKGNKAIIGRPTSIIEEFIKS